MLSRVAECLYWMSRDMERAENIARLIDVNAQLMLDVPLKQAQQLNKNWVPIADCLGEEYLDGKKRSTSAASVTEFLVFDRRNTNSILSCLCSARENARTIREQISTEMWEQVNRAYLWCIAPAARRLFAKNSYAFYQQIKQISFLFQGITDTTMVHGEGWDFIQMGKYLERADKTSRVLDDKYHILHGIDGNPKDALLQWGAVLRSCSARQTYQKIYVSEVKPVKVAELLVLDETFPRSIRFCVHQVDQALRRISGVSHGHFSNAVEKISGRLSAELSFSAIDDIYSAGLHQAMDDLQIKLNQMGAAIEEVYFEPPSPASSNPLAVVQVAQ